MKASLTLSKLDKLAMGIGILAIVFSMVAHPHYGHCHNTDEGYTCTLINYTFGSK